MWVIPKVQLCINFFCLHFISDKHNCLPVVYLQCGTQVNKQESHHLVVVSSHSVLHHDIVCRLDRSASADGRLEGLVRVPDAHCLGRRSTRKLPERERERKQA